MISINHIVTHFPGRPYTSEDLVNALPNKKIIRTLLANESFDMDAVFFKNLGIETRQMAINPFNPDAWWNDEVGKYPFALEGAKTYQKLMADKEPLSGNDKIILISNTPDCTGPHMGYALVTHLQRLNPAFVAPEFITTIIGEGCSGYISGLRESEIFLRAYPHRRVVLLTVEVPTPLVWNHALMDQTLRCGSTGMIKGLIIQRMLFGDGCTASLISHNGKGIRVGHYHRWANLNPEDIHLMEGIGHGTQGGGAYPPTGFFKQKPMDLFHRLGADYLPRVIKVLESLETRPKHYAIHTGSGKILQIIKWGLNLTDKEVDPSARVLRRYGNMNSTTGAVILHQISQQIKDKEETRDVFCVFFGMGFCLQIAH